jgi:hypothetical protein
MLNDFRTLEEKLEYYFKISYYLPCMCMPIPRSPLVGIEQVTRAVEYNS